MRKNILLITAIVSMLIFGLQMAEPAAAASLKQVDHGSYKINGPHNDYFTYSWKTYQYKTNYVKIREYAKFKGEKTQTMTMTLRTESKYILQVREFYNKKWAITYYIPEKRTAAQYYWRVIRPQLLGQGVVINSSGSGSGSNSGIVSSNAVKN